MANLTIRRVQGEELLKFQFPLSDYAFGGTPPLGKIDEAREWLPSFADSIMLVMFADERPIATVLSSPLTQNVRGEIYPLGGVGDVTTVPEERRQGHSRRLLVELFAMLRAEGAVLAGLYPFRASFYERFGFVAFPYVRIVSFSPQTLLPLLRWNLGGQFERMLIADGIVTWCAFTRECQKSIHGMTLFSDRVTTYRQQVMNGHWLVLARFEGEIVGALLYKITGFKEKMLIPNFLYRDSRGKYLLLEWLARHADQVNEVELHLPAGEQPEVWVDDMDAKIRLPVIHYNGMGRILDMAKIGGMQTGPGRFSAKISDPHCPWNEGLYTFETVDGLLQVSPSQTADCELTIQAISALIYGTHDTADFVFRGWGNPSSPVQAIMRTMFPRLQPYMFAIY